MPLWGGGCGEIQAAFDAMPTAKVSDRACSAYPVINVLVQIIDRHHAVTVTVGLTGFESFDDGGGKQ